MQKSPREEGEASGDQQTPKIETEHRRPMSFDVALANSPDRCEDAPEREWNEQVDPREMPWMQALDEQSDNCRGRHQRQIDEAQLAMQRTSFLRQKEKPSSHYERWEDSSQVELDRERRAANDLEIHSGTPLSIIIPPMLSEKLAAARDRRNLPGGGRIVSSVKRALLFLVATAAFAETDLPSLLKKVEKRYNSARTLQIDFAETYSLPGRGRMVEGGQLSLRKPGKMRWTYAKPEGKVFVSDGKFVYFYSPDANRAEKTKLKETEDMRAPLAFLLGKLEFDRDFKEYRSRRDGNDTFVTAIPKSDKLPYTEVSFVVTDQAAIRRLIVTGQDKSVLDFTFTNERVNPALNDGLFTFAVPKGAEFVDTTKQ